MTDRSVTRTVAVAKPRPAVTRTSAGPLGSVTRGSSEGGTNGEIGDDCGLEDEPELLMRLFLNAQVSSAPSSWFSMTRPFETSLTKSFGFGPPTHSIPTTCQSAGRMFAWMT